VTCVLPDGTRKRGVEVSFRERLGLIEYGAEEDMQRYEESDDSDANPGRFLKGILKMLKTFSAQLIVLICKAVAFIDRFAGLSPVVGFVGTFPNISFTLNLEVENLAEASNSSPPIFEARRERASRAPHGELKQTAICLPEEE
jgi:hypothetical protein